VSHDELLDKLNLVWDRDPEETQWELIEKLRNSLRAVVELASTETINQKASGERFYEGFHYALKCVLETIEKELA